MALVDDKYYALIADFVETGFRVASFFTSFSFVHQAHLLNRSDDKAHTRRIIFEFVNEDSGILRALYVVAVSGKALVFFKALCAEFNSIHQEHDLVSVARLGNKLSRLE